MMTKLRRNRESGYVMIAVMFLVIGAVAVVVSPSLFKIMNRATTLERGIQNEQLSLMTESLLARAAYEIHQVIDAQGLDQTVFDNPATITAMKTNVSDWFNGTGLWSGSGFKDNFRNFLSGASPVSQFTPYAVQNGTIEECMPPESCGVVYEGPSAQGGLQFTIRYRASLPPFISGAVTEMRQIVQIGSGSIADFSIFYAPGRDLVVSPGSDTTYEGPIYAGGNVHLTAAKSKTITLTFDPSLDADHGYNVRTSGDLFWFGPRQLGNDPYTYSYVDSSRANDGNYYTAVSNVDYEHDVNGKPVFYYFASNIDPGNTTDGTIQARDNQPADGDYSSLISSSRPRPPYGYFPRGIYETNNPHTSIYTDTTAGSPFGTSQVNTSTAYNLSLPLTIPLNSAWPAFRDSNFLAGSDDYLLQDHAPLQGLVIGGGSDPHILVDMAYPVGISNPPVNPAIPADSDEVKLVKYQWIAHRAQLETGNTDAETAGLALDFRRWKCSSATPPALCGSPANNVNFLPDAAHPTWADPYDWRDTTDNTNPNKFIRFRSEIPPLVPDPLLQPTVNYYDVRRNTSSLKIVEVDIAKLKLAIQGLFLDKPFVLYLGFPKNPVEQSASYGNLKSVVRLVNGADLPDNGLTIVTNAPLQIMGDFNTVAPTGATASCDMKPAAIIADQIMILSNSWQDWQATPATYTDPSDGQEYNSPINPQGTVYSTSDYRAHPIRSNTNADVEVNAILMGGDVPNFLKTTATADSNANTNFNYGSLTNFNFSSLVNGSYLKYQDLQSIYTGATPPADPPGIPGGTPLEDKYKWIPVQVVEFDQNDNPIITTVGTVDSVFNHASDSDRQCASCVSSGQVNVPLYIRVDANGKFMMPLASNPYITYTPIESSYLKPDATGTCNETVGSGKVCTGQGYKIPPGTRFAAAARYGYEAAVSGVIPLLFPDSQTTSTGPYCRWWDGDSYENDPTKCEWNPGNSANGGSTDGSVANPDAIPVDAAHCTNCNYCPACANNVCGGECTQQPQCDPNSCTNCKPATGAPGGTQCYRRWDPTGSVPWNPTPYPVIRYTKGGYYRLWYNRPGNPNAFPQKNTYMYVPYWQAMYNGGLDNFIRLGESWGSKWDVSGCGGSPCTPTLVSGQQNQLTLLGTMHVLWTSKTLIWGITGTTLAPWRSDTYSTPARVFQYSNTLQNAECRPPSLPSTQQINEQNFEQV